jgi:hypothetical protein
MRARILVTYVLDNSWIARAMSAFTARPLVWDENIASRAVHAVAAVCFAMIFARISCDRDDRRNHKTCWSVANKS